MQRQQQRQQNAPQVTEAALCEGPAPMGLGNSEIAEMLGLGGASERQISSEDIVYEQLAHRVIYQGALRPDDIALFRTWGYDPNWTFIDGKEGLQAALITPSEGSCRLPVIVFRGTEPTEMDDIKADLAPEIGGTQYDANRAAIDDLFAAAGRCDVIGHSLGASLAQRAAVEHPAQIRRVVGFQAPGISQENVERFLTSEQRPEVTYHLAKNDLVDLGGEAHLPGTFYHHLPAILDSALGAHTGYLLLSPQYEQAREALGLTPEVLDRLDEANKDMFGVEHDIHSLRERWPATRSERYHRPLIQEGVEWLRQQIGEFW